MANLAQYSAGSYQIGDGVFDSADIDTQGPAATVTDAQIQDEIRAQIAAGHLPKPDQDILYCVFTPPNVVVVDARGASSAKDFSGYHDYAPGSDGFPYAVIPYDGTLPDPRLMTIYDSHELAEAVTDPEPSDTTLGWYDNNRGEIADITASLFAAGRIGQMGLLDELVGSDGTPYLVRKVWSIKDMGPVAFAAI